jgi:phospho-N-acetylmuramoyl-pentapeptide-transferase
LTISRVADTWEAPVLLDIFEIHILRYITVRAALAAITAFVLGIACGPSLIAALRARRIADQNAKGDCKALDALNAEKRATPTMGGLLIVGASVVSTLLFARLDAFFVQLGLAVVLALGTVGFLDDRAKLVTSGRGLSARAKLRAETAIGLLAGLAIFFHYAMIDNRALAESFRFVEDEAAARAAQHFVRGTDLYLPFAKSASIPMGILYVGFAALVLVATCNAVNMTDGMDGLAAGTSIFTIGTFVAIAYVMGRADFTEYLRLPFVPGAGEAAVLGSAALGATLSFLWFNAHPAEVFMGDTGSLALGGVVAVLALAVKQELLLPIAGGVFVLEGLSVVLQVGSVKLRGKRIFICAPVHHHFHLGGLKETKVTIRLWIVSAILALLALATLKVR